MLSINYSNYKLIYIYISNRKRFDHTGSSSVHIDEKEINKVKRLKNGVTLIIKINGIARSVGRGR